jgi:hypothetical protein
MSPATPASAAPSPSTPRRALRTLLALVVPVLAAAGLVLTTTAPAHAEAGYRYWNYAHLQGEEWTFADTGPGDFTPEDGAVEGWRYGTSTVSQGIFPRADLGEVTFDAACEGVEAAADEKRVAVLVDFGTEADADGAEIPEPRAECAVVPADATGRQVLESVVDVRAQKDMVCALDGYPTQGCGDLVADAEVAANEGNVEFTMAAAEDTEPVAAEDEDSAVSWPLIGVGVVVLLLAAVAVPLYRRNRDA